MRKLKPQVDRNLLQVVYIIRPLVEYADVVLDNCAQYEINELEKKYKMRLLVLLQVHQN